MTHHWKSFAGFLGLTVFLLALVPLLSMLTGASMDFGAVAQRASETTGVAWTSNLWNVVRLAWAEPGLGLLLLGSAVPTLAALVMLGATRDRRGLGQLLASLHPFGRGGSFVISLQIYGQLVVGIVLCLLAAFVLRDALAPGQYTRGVDVLSLGIFTSLLSAAFLDQGAVLEEGGWRGYATPLLQGTTLSPVLCAVVIGIAWGLWHFPRDVVSGLPERLGIAAYLFAFLPSFILGTVSVSIIAAYFMNRLGGSLIPAIMVHGLTNDAAGISGFTTIERALTPFSQITRALPLCVLAAFLVWRSGRQLGRQIASTEGE